MKNRYQFKKNHDEIIIEDDTPETRNHKITAKPSQLLILEELFHTMQVMGDVGASRRIVLYVDGDGAFHPRFTDDNGDPIKTNIDNQCDVVDVNYGRIKKNPEDEKYPDNDFWKYYDFG